MPVIYYDYTLPPSLPPPPLGTAVVEMSAEEQQQQRKAAGLTTRQQPGSLLLYVSADCEGGPAVAMAAGSDSGDDEGTLLCASSPW